MFADVDILAHCHGTPNTRVDDLFTLFKRHMLKSEIIIPYDEAHEGLFYWIGTHGRTTPYRNPGVLNYVECDNTATFTTIAEYMHTKEHFIDKDLAYTYAGNADANFTVSLEPCQLSFNPTHYSIATMIKQSRVFLRTWNFEGSNDNNSEVTIKHVAFNWKAWIVAG